ncbi:MAG: DUF2244 domain-containing protein, partial [Pseudomonadota bacterium]
MFPGSATNQAAGGEPLAASVSGPLWRDRKDRPVYRVELWPNQSLTPTGLRVVLGVTAAMLCVPLISVLGTAVFWGLLPFMVAAFWALWYAIRRNGRNLSLSETLSVWSDEIRVERREPNGHLLRWMAEPLRTRVRVHKDAKIEDYLTLTG